MAKFQNQQKMFMQQARLSAGGGDDVDDEDESDEDAPPAPADPSRGPTPPPPENLPKCTLCRTSLTPIHDQHHKPMGLIALVQRSSVLATVQARANTDRWWERPEFNTAPRTCSKVHRAKKKGERGREKRRERKREEEREEERRRERERGRESTQ
jgi:hypothetical protein